MTRVIFHPVISGLIKGGVLRPYLKWGRRIVIEFEYSVHFKDILIIVTFVQDKNPILEQVDKNQKIFPI